MVMAFPVSRMKIPSGLAELAEGADERICFASRRSIGHADLP
jgi:hypothetical protein